MLTLEHLKRRVRPGRVYRREDLLPWSRSIDRHLKQLTTDGTLHKFRNGLYYFPRKFEFGEAPPDEHELVRAFLKRQFRRHLSKCLQPTRAWDESALQQARYL